MRNGKYEGKVSDACVGRSRNGSLQVELLLATEDGQSCSWFGSMSGGAMKYTIETLKFIGLKDGEGPEVLIGKVVHFELYDDEYNGKTSQKVKIYTRVGLLTKKEDRIVGKAAAALLFPTTCDRQPGEDLEEMPDWMR